MVLLVNSLRIYCKDANLASVLGTQHDIAPLWPDIISSVVLPAVLHVGVPAVRRCESSNNDIVAAGCRLPVVVVDDDDDGSHYALEPPPLITIIEFGRFDHPTTDEDRRRARLLRK